MCLVLLWGLDCNIGKYPNLDRLSYKWAITESSVNSINSITVPLHPPFLHSSVSYSYCFCSTFLSQAAIKHTHYSSNTTAKKSLISSDVCSGWKRHYFSDRIPDWHSVVIICRIGLFLSHWPLHVWIITICCLGCGFLLQPFLQFFTFQWQKMSQNRQSSLIKMMFLCIYLQQTK